MIELTLLRHGESKGLKANILQGRIDYPLTDNGKEQIRILANYWQHQGESFDEIITSPLKRAKETSEIIASYLNISNICEDSIWMERNFGEGEGVDLQEIVNWKKHISKTSSFEPIFNTGETEWQIHVRAGKAIDQLMMNSKANILVVSHGNMINAVLHMIFGILPTGGSLPIELPLGPGCYSRVRYYSDQDRWSLISFNDRQFLNSKYSK